MAPIANLQVRLSAQIAEFQSAFRTATATTEKFQNEFQTTATKASAMGNLIARGAEMGVRAFVDLGKAALENADAIRDLASQTGLSMRAIQEFQHVAAETGTTVDSWTNAAFKLGVTLAGGGKSVEAGVTALGLSFEELKKKTPEDQFRTVIKALEDMDTQQDRNRVGVLLFGKGYKEMAAAVNEGYTDLAKDAHVMSDETVDRLADAQEAWERFGRAVTIISGEVIAAAMEKWDRFQRFLANISFPGAFGPGGPGGPMKDVELPGPPTPTPPPVIRRTADEVAALKRELAEAAEEAKRFWAELSPSQTLGITGGAPGFQLPIPTPELLSQYGVEIKEGITGGLPGIEIPVTLPPAAQVASPFADALKKDLERIPMILRNAVVSGDWLGAAMEIGTNIGATIGQGIGTALGGKAGGLIGEAIGSLVGPLIGKIFGDTEYEKRVKKAAEDFQKIRAEAIETAGGLERLRHQFSIVGIEIDSAFKARDPAWLRQVLDEGYAKTQLLTEAMQEYGFTWEHLGAEGRALQLSDLLTDLKAKTDILIGAGIDELSVLQKQEKQYEDLLVKAIATNTEIPLAMKPLLERMQELGLLTDEATGEFIDLGQVTWAKSLTQGFDQVTKAIYDLRDALTKGVGGALDDLGRKSVRIPIGFDIENPPKGVPALASGGIVRRPTLALVGESGPEAVVPLSQLGGAAGGDQTIILEMDGRAVARVVVPLIPGEVRRYGLVS